MQSNRITKTAMGLVAAVILFTGCSSAFASDGEGWQNEVTIYAWLAEISGSIPVQVDGSQEISYDAEDILDSLEGVFMGGYAGYYQKFSVIVDLLYMAVDGDGSTSIPSGTATADLDIDSWVFSAGVGYEVMKSDNAMMSVVAGLRYLDLEVETDLSRNGTQVHGMSGSQDLLDGLIGLRGFIKLNENWFLPYYADIGTGDSDYSYNLFAGIGYQFGWGDVRFGYRHLAIEMEDEKFMEDMTVSGPILGIGFKF